MTRILCAGIATLDQIFSLEAMPERSEKYRARDLVVTSGGTAANGAVAIARLGGKACLFGALGDDPRGDEIVAGLTAEGVDCAGVRRVAGRTSPLSAILVDSAGARIVETREILQPLHRESDMGRKIEQLRPFVGRSIGIEDRRHAGFAGEAKEMGRALGFDAEYGSVV